MRRLRRSLALAWIAAFMASCTPARAPQTSSHSVKDLSSMSLPAGAREISAIMGHEFQRSVAVHDVPRARMRHVIEDHFAARAGHDAEDVAFMKAFGFVAPDVVLAASATVRLQAEQLVGLYLPDERAIYVRPRARGSTVTSSDVIHELAHALQDDTFRMTSLADSSLGVDELLARRAVYEGDAVAVTWAVEGGRTGHSALDAIADHRGEARASTATLGIPQEMEASPELARASVLVRMEVLFPYSAGSELVAHAFMLGGPALVDGLFRKLPVSTEQVLHPQKYFEGEAPIRVPVPAAPPGATLVASGTMGELRTRAFLELTLPASRAVSDSEGWGGDTYAIFSRTGAPGYAILWSTAWDDEDHAKRFASALEEATRCTAAPCPFGAVATRRRGTHVAWTRGLDDTSVVTALLSLPGKAPPHAPPHGNIPVRAESADDEVLVAEGGDPDLRAPLLGLRSRLPPRFASVRLRHTDVSISDAHHHGRGSITHDDDPYDPAAFPRTVASIAPIFAGNAPIGRERIRDVSLRAGVGKEVRWSPTDGVGEMRFLALSACDGRKSLFVTVLARTEETRVALDQWVQSIEPMDPAEAPFCKTAK